MREIELKNIPQFLYRTPYMGVIVKVLDTYDRYDPVHVIIYLNFKLWDFSREDAHKLVGKVIVAYLYNEIRPLLLQVRIEEVTHAGAKDRGHYFNAKVIASENMQFQQYKLPDMYFKDTAEILKCKLFDGIYSEDED